MNLPTALVILSLLFLTPTAQRTCFAGTFRSGPTCKPCPPGTFSSDFNVLSCTACPPRTFRSRPAAATRKQCFPCPAGTSSNVPGAPTCTRCPPGQYSLPRAKTCASCPPGHELNSASKTGCKQCPPDTASPGGNQPCLLCPEGSFSEQGSFKCTKCPRGTFRNRRSFRCAPCSPGTYSAVKGATSCNRCPLGTVSRFRATECSPCPRNTFSNLLPSKKCLPCPDGTSTKAVGAAGCKSSAGCPRGTFEARSGICKACLPGERLDSSRMKCVPCGDNEISQGGDAADCSKCPTGQEPLGDFTFLEKSACACTPGSVFELGIGCVRCRRGFFWERTPPLRKSLLGSGAECRICPVGTFAKKPGSLECLKCPENTFADLRGSSSCQPCPPGTKSPVFPVTVLESFGYTDRGSCVNETTGCNAGEKLRRDGKCEVVSCPSKNQFIGRSFFKKKECQACSTNMKIRFDRFGLGKCEVCKQNEISSGGAATTCERCPRGMEAEGFPFPRCRCSPGTALHDGRCVDRCPKGMGLKFLEIEKDFLGETDLDVCTRCSEVSTRAIPIRRTLCVTCRRNFILVNGTRCMLCPKGMKVATNIFGEPVNSCRPK